MGRKTQFDEESVLAAAQDVFWRRGYQGASISELTAETGLSRSSLYQRFGDKDGLFSEVVERYTQVVVARMQRATGASGRETLRALLSGFSPSRREPGRPVGCLLARSCTEMSALPEDARQLIHAGIQAQRDVLERLIQLGERDGSLKSETDRLVLTWHLVGVLHAIVNLPEVGAGPEIVEKMIDIAMLAWPAIPDKKSSHALERQIQ